MAGVAVSTTINGDHVEYLCQPDETLLDVLRDRLGLTGAKEGCGTGDCGACSIILDNRLVCSLPGARRGSRGPNCRDRRGHGAWRSTASLQQKFLEHAAPAMRHLHAGLPDRGEGPSGQEPRSD